MSELSADPFQDLGSVKIRALLFFSGVTVIRGCRGDGPALGRIGKRRVLLFPEDVAVNSHRLDFIEIPPENPFRPARLAGGIPAEHDLSDVTFEKWLMIENYYQGFISTGRIGLIVPILRMLTRRRLRRPKDWELMAVFFWIRSVKKLFCRRFPALFRPVSSVSGDNAGISKKILEESYNAQLRALTKGDVLKEKEIMHISCHRALNELDAQAREYEDLKKQLGPK